jgi:predicted TIM-barrel fold metal-dependent hydrolase
VSIIDSHTHIFPPEVIARREAYLQRDAWFGRLYANPKARMASAEDLIAAMDQAGVDVAVTFGFAWADPGLCHAANQYVLQTVSRWPRRLVGFAVVNPAAEGALAELELCLHGGLRGLGELMPDGQGYALDDARLDELVHEMGLREQPILIHAGEPVGHTYPGKSRSTLQPFYELALRHPQATLVAAHWGGGLLFYELMPEVRHALQNVYYDTAASPFLYRDDIFSLAAQIAPQKVLWGTDYPLLDPGRFLQRVLAAGLAEGHRSAILGGNAAHVLGIDKPLGSPADPKGFER